MWRSAVQVCLGLRIACKAMCTGFKAWDYASPVYYLSSGGLAQLARAPALHAGGQRFESVILHEMVSVIVIVGLEIFDILTQDKL